MKALRMDLTDHGGNISPLRSPMAEIVGTDYPLIPEGDYEAYLDHHETSAMFGGKVFLWFKIADLSSSHNGIMLFKAYNVKGLKGKPGKNRRFIVGARSNFVKDTRRLFETGRKAISISAQDFKGKLFTVRVRTVTRDQNQGEWAKENRYSVIEEIVNIQAG